MKTKLQLTLLLGLIANLTFGQVQMPTAPQPAQFQHFGTQNFQNPTNSIPDPMDMFWGTNEQERIKKQNQQIIREVEMNEQRRIEAQRQLYANFTPT